MSNLVSVSQWMGVMGADSLLLTGKQTPAYQCEDMVLLLCYPENTAQVLLYAVADFVGSRGGIWA